MRDEEGKRGEGIAKRKGVMGVVNGEPNSEEESRPAKRARTPKGHTTRHRGRHLAIATAAQVTFEPTHPRDVARQGFGPRLLSVVDL